MKIDDLSRSEARDLANELGHNIQHKGVDIAPSRSAAYLALGAGTPAERVKRSASILSRYEDGARHALALH